MTQASRKKRPPTPQVVSERNRVGDRYLVPVVCGVLVLAVALVFGQTLGFDFVDFDDNEYVVKNEHVIEGLSVEGLIWAFTTDHAGNWHPLTWLSHQLDCQLYGLNPRGHHLTNLLLHAASAVLLFLVLRRMTGHLWPSAFAAAVFAVHPLRAESVAWVAERKDLLSGLFFMLTLWAYAEYVLRPFSRFRYVVVVLLFALGLMAKPMLVTLPLVLLLLDYWPLGRTQNRGWRLWTEKIPLFALSAASCVITPLAQGAAVARLEFASPVSRVANALVSYVAYVVQFVYPAGLAAYYPHPRDPWPAWRVLGSALLLGGICAAAWFWRKKRPYFPVGWFWYMGMLVPVIGLVQVGAQAMADRYTYLPQIGLLIVLAWGAREAVERRRISPRAAAAVAALAVFLWMVCAFQQTTYWRDNEILWRRVLSCTAKNPLANRNYGVALEQRGRIDEAEAQYREALRHNPQYVQALLCLGSLLSKQGRADEAIACFDKAFQLDPNCGNAAIYNNLGAAHAKRGDFAAAVAQYQKALILNPSAAMALNNLGAAYYSQGRMNEAVECFQRGVETNPQSADAHCNLANALAALRRDAEAESEYRKALALNPQHADAGFFLGMVLERRGNPREALALWNEQLRTRPNDIRLLNQAAWASATSADASVRNGDRAVALALRAAELTRHRHPIMLDTLAAAYAEAGRFPEAVETAQRALDIASGEKNPGAARFLEGLKRRIALYRSGVPYRDASAFTGPEMKE